MLGASHIGIANDNDPADRFPQGDAVGFRAALIDKQREYHTLRNAPSNSSHWSDIGFSISVLLWVASLVGFALTHWLGQPIPTRLLTCMALIWTGLWQAYLSMDRRYTRLSEISVLSAIIGFVVTLLTATTYLGLPLGAVEGLCVFSITSIIIAILLRSQTALMASISACLCWAALHFDGYVTPSTSAAILPALLCFQILIAAKFRAQLPIIAAVLVCYLWFFGLCYTMVAASNLSPLFASAAIFMIANLHYRGAKAAESEGFDGMAPHITFSWTVSILTLIAIQHFYLMPDSQLWMADWQHSAFTQLGWLATIGITALLITICGFVRRRHGLMNFSSIILMTTLTLGLPALVLYKVQASALIEHYMGLSAHPNIGFLMGGIILTWAIFFMLNALRRRRYFMCFVALLVLGLQADLTFNSEFSAPISIALLSIGSLATIMITSLISLGKFDPHHRPLMTMEL